MPPSTTPSVAALASVFTLGPSTLPGSSALAAALGLPLDAAGRLAPAHARDVVTLEHLVATAAAIADARVARGADARALAAAAALLGSACSHAPAWPTAADADAEWIALLADLRAGGSDAEGGARTAASEADASSADTAGSGESELAADATTAELDAAASAVDSWVRSFGLLAPRPFAMLRDLWATGESLSEPRMLVFRPIVDAPPPVEAMLPLSSAAIVVE